MKFLQWKGCGICKKYKHTESRNVVCCRLLTFLKNVKEVIGENQIINYVYPKKLTLTVDNSDKWNEFEVAGFIRDGCIIIAKIVEENNFKVEIYSKTEVSSIVYKGVNTSREDQRNLSAVIHFKDGNKFEMDSKEDANEAWREEYSMNIA